jgi:hypothetical protein
MAFFVTEKPAARASGATSYGFTQTFCRPPEDEDFRAG